MTTIDSIVKENDMGRIKTYILGCINPASARLYGTFQERAALNITQFPKIQGSLLIRMGLVYPFVSYVVDQLGIPKDCQSEFHGVAINYHTWIAGYAAYVIEIQLGLSKYPFELMGKALQVTRDYIKK